MKKNNTNQYLGELEAEIMEIIWELEDISVRRVLNRLRKKKKVAYTTVMTVMTRLYDKGILRRKMDDTGAYIYSPTQDKQTFLAVASKKAINHLLKEYGEVAVAQFMDIIESSHVKDLEEWRQKLKKIK